MSDSPVSAACCSGCRRLVALRFGLLLVACLSVIATSAGRSSGGPMFAAKVDYGTGSSPYSVAIGDVSGDGKPDLAVANYSSNTVSVLLGRALAAAVDLDPNVINLASHAPWVNAYIEPSEFAPTSIDISTLRLAGSVAAAPKFAVVGDHNRNGTPDLMVRFGRSALDPLLAPGVDSLELTGS